MTPSPTTGNYSAKLTELTEAIVRAVPEIREVYDRCMQCGYGYEFCKHTSRCRNPDYYDRPIVLDDVLIYLNKPITDERECWFVVEDTGRILRFWDYTTGDCEHIGLWKLGKSLAEQDETLISLLLSLCPKK